MNGAIDTIFPHDTLEHIPSPWLLYQSYIQPLQLLNYFNEYPIRAALGQVRPKGPDAISVKHGLVFDI